MSIKATQTNEKKNKIFLMQFARWSKYLQISFQIKVHVVFNHVYVSYFPFLIEEGYKTNNSKIFQTTTQIAEESLGLEFEKHVNMQLPWTFVEEAECNRKSSSPGSATCPAMVRSLGLWVTIYKVGAVNSFCLIINTTWNQHVTCFIKCSKFSSYSCLKHCYSTSSSLFKTIPK